MMCNKGCVAEVHVIVCCGIVLLQYGAGVCCCSMLFHYGGAVWCYRVLARVIVILSESS